MKKIYASFFFIGFILLTKIPVYAEQDITYKMKTLISAEDRFNGEQLNKPVCIKENPATGDLVIADYGNHCLYVFSKDGKFKQKIGKPGEAAGQLQRPLYIAFSDNGDIYVLEKENSRISVFSKDGTFLKCIRLQNTLKYSQLIPQFSVTSTNNILISNPGLCFSDSNYSLAVLSETGSVIKHIGNILNTSYLVQSDSPLNGIPFVNAKNEFVFFPARKPIALTFDNQGTLLSAFDVENQQVIILPKNRVTFTEDEILKMPVTDLTKLLQSQSNIQVITGVKGGREQILQITGMSTQKGDSLKKMREQMNTGKIEGYIRDKATNTPIIGSIVIIEGSNPVIGAITDAKGYYIINNIYPGIYTLIASFVGYTTERQENIKVNADTLTEVNFLLIEKAITTKEVRIRGNVDVRVGKSLEKSTFLPKRMEPGNQPPLPLLYLDILYKNNTYYLLLRPKSQDDSVKILVLNEEFKKVNTITLPVNLNFPLESIDALGFDVIREGTIVLTVPVGKAYLFSSK